MIILGFSFGKSRQLDKAGYKKAFHTGQTISSCYFVAHFTLNQAFFARLGIIVAKKKLAKSTQRHWLKRIVRERFRLSQDKLQGMDIVVVVRKTLNTIDKETIKSDLDFLWIKLIKCCKKLS